jgi:hypothetical protein
MARTPAKGRKAETETRSAKATSRRPRAGGEVEVVEEAPGLGATDAEAILTFVALVVAFVLVDMHLGRYDAGVFF